MKTKLVPVDKTVPTDEEWAELEAAKDGTDEDFQELLSRLAGAKEEGRRLVVSWGNHEILHCEVRPDV